MAPSAAAEAQSRARPQALQPAGPGLMHRRAARIALRAALALVVAAVSVAAAWAVRANVTSTDPPPSRPARVVELGSASLRTPSGWAPEVAGGRTADVTVARISGGVRP